MKKHAAIAGLALLPIGIAYIRAVFSHQDCTGGIPRDVVGSLPDSPPDQYMMKAEESACQAKEDKNTQFGKLIAGFYRGETERLPADPSEYEREVSVEEIRTNALKYFGVSSEKLDRILKKYH